MRMARRACVQMNDPDAARDISLDLHSLPLVAEHGWWLECMESGRCVHAIEDAGTHVSVFPVEERGRVIGMLEVIAMERMPARDATLVQGMLRILKNQLALLEYGESDTLTGLLNRKTFETRLHKVAARLRENEAQPASKSDQACWLGLLDVDHFKAINDNYGHLFGDEVLLLVSQVMRDTFRGADALFRFGGEEFVILLEQADERGASIAFERLRRAVESFSFPQSARVTVSIGYTRIKLQDVPTTCVERADAALYFAKHHGRNNVRQFETLVAAGELKAGDKEGDVELF
jgi:diguanylate cyclase (GGDEF)-like protein